MLVSAIMPARGRQRQALECAMYWRAQSWSPCELIVMDDTEDPAFPNGFSSSRVQYVRLGGRLTIGAKRNLACGLAKGEIIAHFDSDDFYAPDRVFDQTMRLEISGKAVTSYRNIKFTDGENWWLNTNWPGGYGASLAYRRDWWAAHPFPEVRCGEDWYFVTEAMQAQQFIAADAKDFMYATIHAGNTAQRVIGAGWTRL